MNAWVMLSLKHEKSLVLSKYQLEKVCSSVREPGYIFHAGLGKSHKLKAWLEKE